MTKALDRERTGIRLVQGWFGCLRWQWEVWREVEVVDTFFERSMHTWRIVNKGRCRSREEAERCAAFATFVEVVPVLPAIKAADREAIDA